MNKIRRCRGDPPDRSPSSMGAHTSSSQVRLHGVHKSSIEVARKRLLLGAGLFIVGFFVVSLRLVEVALFSEPHHLSARNESIKTGVGPARADIVDRNGVVLATSLTAQSLHANPLDIRNPLSAAARLAGVLPELDSKEVVLRLESDKQFVWLKRHLTPRQVSEVNALGEPGFKFEEEPRRVYPHGSLVAHAIGYAKLDNRGLGGLEHSYDERLLAHPNNALSTSIDIRFQYVMHEELMNAVLMHQALGAVGIILDITTGGMRALVSLPDFDPNDGRTIPSRALFNRATLGAYEMGSTFKVFTAAMALDQGMMTLQDGFDTSEPLRIGGKVIKDFHGKARWLSVPEIFIYSSNIGAAKMALAVGSKVQRAFLAKLGMLTRSDLELPEVGAPLYPDPWREVHTATIGFGHGIAVNAVQLTAGIAALINGGFYRPPTLIARNEEHGIQQRVVSASTSRSIRQLLRLTVTHGTGGKAEVAGYWVGGKTGTAEKVGSRGYDQEKVLSSFVGVFPITDPRYLVFAMLDEPKGTSATHGYATGGWTAAPVVRRVIARIGPISGMAPVTSIASVDGSPTTVISLDGNEIHLAAY